jgi:GntR family transcriptional regulator
VSREEPVELHEQVAAEIRRAIAEGEAKPGERLPPAKDLAAVLDVNANTVLRALRTLRDEGLLEFRRGRGITVAGTPERGAVVAKAKELERHARVGHRQGRHQHLVVLRSVERRGRLPRRSAEDDVHPPVALAGHHLHLHRDHREHELSAFGAEQCRHLHDAAGHDAADRT